MYIQSVIFGLFQNVKCTCKERVNTGRIFLGYLIGKYLSLFLERFFVSPCKSFHSSACEQTMPWTQIHPFYGCFIIHYCFGGNLHSSAVFWVIFWGSSFPDLPRKLYLFGHLFLKNLEYNYLWADWAHSFPISLFMTIVSYIIYCHISNKSMKESICLCLGNNISQKQTMHPHLNTNKQLNEQTNLLKDNKDIEIVSVTTYSTIESMKHIDHRQNSFEYKYGSSLSCRNCWCDCRSFWKLCAYFFLSVFLHCCLDFPFHHSNAHSQFLPFSMYIFRSPLSYYEYEYYGYIVGPILCGITIILSIWIYVHKREDWKTDSKYYHLFWILVLVINDSWCLYEIVKPFIV